MRRFIPAAVAAATLALTGTVAGTALAQSPSQGTPMPQDPPNAPTPLPGPETRQPESHPPDGVAPQLEPTAPGDPTDPTDPSAVIVPMPDQRQAAPAPLTTGTRPEDTATTEPMVVDPGLDGAAPSDTIPRLNEEALPDGAAAEDEGEDPEVALSQNPAPKGDLVGRAVTGSEGEEIGTVYEVLTSREGGDVRAFVIELAASGSQEGRHLITLPADEVEYEAEGPVRAHRTAAELNGEEPGQTAEDAASDRPADAARQD